MPIIKKKKAKHRPIYQYIFSVCVRYLCRWRVTDTHTGSSTDSWTPTAAAQSRWSPSFPPDYWLQTHTHVWVINTLIRADTLSVLTVVKQFEVCMVHLTGRVTLNHRQHVQQHRQTIWNRAEPQSEHETLVMNEK